MELLRGNVFARRFRDPRYVFENKSIAVYARNKYMEGFAPSAGRPPLRS